MKFPVFIKLAAALLCLTLLAGCAAGPAPSAGPASGEGAEQQPSTTGGSVSTSSTSTTITKEPVPKPENPVVTAGIYSGDDPAHTLLLYDVTDSAFSVCFSSLLFGNYCMSIRADAALSGNEAVLTFQNDDPQSSYGGLLTIDEDRIHAALRRSGESTADFTADYKLIHPLPDDEAAHPFSLTELLVEGRSFDLITAEDADALYGQPVETEEYEFYNDTAQRREYEGVSLDIYKTVFLALFTDPEFEAPRGVGVGDDWETVLSKFPDAGGELVMTDTNLLHRVLYGDNTYRQSYGEIWWMDAETPAYILYADSGYTLTYVITDGKVSAVEFAVPTN